MKTETCSVCGKTHVVYMCGQTGEREEGSKIFGYTGPDHKNPTCEDCCGDADRKYMMEHGKIHLYLTKHTHRDRKPYHSIERDDDIVGSGGSVSNWPGSLRFPVYPRIAVGNHNIAGRQYRAWFVGPDGHIWTAVQYGDNTQICVCKRTKDIGNWALKANSI